MPQAPRASNNDAAPDVWAPIGPNGITANALAAVPNNADMIFAGGLAGLYKTVDGGISWTLASEQTVNQFVDYITVHPTNHNVLFAWFRSNLGPLSINLMRSTDEGKTWDAVLHGNRTTVDVQIDPLNPNRMFAFSDSVYRSSDGGLSWRSVSIFNNTQAFAIYRQNPEIVYAAAGSTFSLTLYKSTDAGQTWAVRNFRLPAFTRPEIVLEVSSLDDDILFLGSSSFDGTGGFYRSIDGGINWLRLTTGFGRSASVSALAIDPMNPNVLYAGGFANGVYLSTDTGDSWRLISSAVPDHYVHDIDVRPDGVVDVAFGGNLYRTSNQGTSWRSLNGNLQNLDVFDVVPHPSDPLTIYAGSLGGVYRSRDGGASWQTVNDGILDNDAFALAIDASNPLVLYAGTFGGLIYKTTTGGDIWVEKSTGLLGLGGVVGISKISVHPKNPSWLWTGSFRSYQSTNGGETWSPFNIAGRRVNDAVYDPLRPDTLFAFTTIDTLFRSIDGGATWNTRRTGLRISTLAVDPHRPNVLYADSSGRIIKSVTGGLTWQRVDEGLSTRELLVNPENSDLVYAATFNRGVRRSTDGANTWSDYNNGLPHLSTFSVKTATGQPHTLLVATFGGSIYRVEETPTAVAESLAEPSGFALAQNYPNPFNAATGIEYSVPRTSQVTLKIYNVAGAEVAVLVDERKEAGVYEAKFEAGNLASGVYFYRLQVAPPRGSAKTEFAQIKKFVLVR
ncbi:T9SS type A sorting domain-containing protein [candidate division KSB1 bacterium]|nr:T9SS type A sorting domain-containing protein [candidate division KSB1 bacterium]